jgi:hypothetical protein
MLPDGDEPDTIPPPAVARAKALASSAGIATASEPQTAVEQRISHRKAQPVHPEPHPTPSLTSEERRRMPTLKSVPKPVLPERPRATTAQVKRRTLPSAKRALATTTQATRAYEVHTDAKAASDASVWKRSLRLASAPTTLKRITKSSSTRLALLVVLGIGVGVLVGSLVKWLFITNTPAPAIVLVSGQAPPTQLVTQSEPAAQPVGTQAATPMAPAPIALDSRSTLDSRMNHALSKPPVRRTATPARPPKQKLKTPASMASRGASHR